LETLEMYFSEIYKNNS